MASSYSSDLKLELMATGENAGTWGTKTNNNLNLVQQGVAGYQAIDVASSDVVLAMTDHISNLRVLKELRNSGYKGKIMATASFEDEIEELKKEGANEAFNLYAEAGVGFAEHISRAFETKR